MPKVKPIKIPKIHNSKIKPIPIPNIYHGSLKKQIKKVKR